METLPYYFGLLIKCISALPGLPESFRYIPCFLGQSWNMTTFKNVHRRVNFDSQLLI